MLNKKFDFVSTGIATYVKLTHSVVNENKIIDELVLDYFSKIPTSNHNFSILYNAFTEGNIGEFWNNRFPNVFDNIYSDSGGLQMITRGMSMDQGVKDKIYLAQCKHSDYGMCFDEIPVKIIEGDKSRKGSEQFSRIYDPTILAETARNTGLNIRRQIEIYLDEKVKTLPVVILQGNCEDSYRIWFEEILKQVPKENHKYIKCVAAGAAALGQGYLEDIQRLVYTSLTKEYLPEINHIHILGVGSIKRMLPSILFADNILKDFRISYDSTKWSSAPIFGQFWSKNNKMCRVKRYFDRVKYSEILEDIKEQNDLCNMDVETFYEAMNTSVSNYHDKTGNGYFTVAALFGISAKSIYNFVRTVDNLYENRNDVHLLKKYSGRDSRLYQSLLGINNVDDYRHWEKMMIHNISSKKIRKNELSILEDLF